MRALLALFLSVPLFSGVFAQPSIVSVNPDTLDQGAHSSVIIVVSGLDDSGTVVFTCPGDISISAVSRPVPTFRVVTVVVRPTARIGCCDVVITNHLTGLADTLINGICIRNPDRFPPNASLVFPPPNAVISCVDSFIKIRAIDPTGIAALSPACTLFFDGIPYPAGSPNLVYVLGDSTFYFEPPVSLSEGRHTVRMVGICDTFNNCRTLPETEFQVDLSPPVVTATEPCAGTILDVLFFAIRATVSDTLSGVDSTALRMTMVQSSRPTDTTTVGIMDLGAEYSAGVFTFRPDRVGISFVDHDTVNVCLSGIVDLASVCGTNARPETCWTYSIAIPTATSITVSLGHMDASAFPVIRTTALVTSDLGLPVPGLLERNFSIAENDELQYPFTVHDIGGTNGVDIVFVFDETGSMSGPQDQLIAGLTALCDSLTRSSLDFRLGLISYRDIDEPREINSEGYSLFFHGNLTADVEMFRDSLRTLVCIGGGDSQENLLDAIWRAIHDINYRPGSRRILVCMTNDTYCERGDGSWNCQAHWMGSEILNELLDGEITVFIFADLARDTHAMYRGPGSFTEETGGRFYPFETEVLAMVPALESAALGGYALTYTTSDPIADCTPRRITVTAASGTLRASASIDYAAPCSPNAWIESPLPGIITSDSHQQIRMVITPGDSIPIDPSSLRLRLGEEMYEIGSNMTLGPLYLTLQPLHPFLNDEVVNVSLIQCYDLQGHFPLTGPISWSFQVDLEGPTVDDLTPSPGATISDPVPLIGFTVHDNLTVVDTASMLMGIEVNGLHVASMGLGSPGIIYAFGRYTYDPTAGGISFSPGDSVCVVVDRLNDHPDLGRANNLEDRPVTWFFRIASAKQAGIPPLAAGDRLSIYSTDGRLLRRVTESSWDERDDLGRPVPSGIYLYRIEDAKGGQRVGRIPIIR